MIYRCARPVAAKVKGSQIWAQQAAPQESAQEPDGDATQKGHIPLSMPFLLNFSCITSPISLTFARVSSRSARVCEAEMQKRARAELIGVAG